MARQTTPPEVHKDLEKHLTKAINLLYEGIVSLEDFSSEAQEPFYNRINRLVDSYKSIEELRPYVKVDVPMALFKNIDAGKNPELYTQETLKACVKQNEVTKGKIEAFKDFSKCLESEIKEQFADEFETFVRLKAEAEAQQKAEGENKQEPDAMQM